MTAQDQTLQQYHHWMTVNATGHLIRAGRQSGIFDELRQGQRTLEQLCSARQLSPKPAQLLLDALVAIGIVEQYQQDYALSRAAHLLCQYDDDLGDRHWQPLVEAVHSATETAPPGDQIHFDHTAATQWIHTPAAMQAAEVLDIGGTDQGAGLSILDLGCGSAVWSCAMAHRDPAATITAVDHRGALEAARRTAESIGLGDRFQAIEGVPAAAELPVEGFDLVLLAQRLSGLGDRAASALLSRAVDAARAGGRVVVIDLFRGPGEPPLVEAIEALRLELRTEGGRLRTLQETQAQFATAGLSDIQFTYLAASHVNLGLAVGVR